MREKRITQPHLALARRRTPLLRVQRGGCENMAPNSLFRDRIHSGIHSGIRSGGMAYAFTRSDGESFLFVLFACFILVCAVAPVYVFNFSLQSF